MISPKSLEQLKQIFHEDGIELTDATALEVGVWLLERFKSVGATIPFGKADLFNEIQTEIGSARALYKNNNVRKHVMNQCKEISKV